MQGELERWAKEEGVGVHYTADDDVCAKLTTRRLSDSTNTSCTCEHGTMDCH